MRMGLRHSMVGRKACVPEWQICRFHVYFLFLPELTYIRGKIFYSKGKAVTFVSERKL